jgi:excisionase family DNA binding protein
MFPRANADADAMLAEVHAAKLLNLSTRTLQAWRLSSRGPAFVRAGRAVRYRRSDLLAWIEANTVMTSETGSTEREARNA